MAEALPGEVLAGVVTVLLGGAVLVAGEALLDARRIGSPWRTAMLAPVADAARLLRRGALMPSVAVALAACVLVVGLGVVALPALVVALLGPSVAAAWARGCTAAIRAARVQAPAVLALLAPLVAAGAPGTGAVLRSQEALWGAVGMPGTTVLVLAAALTAVGRGPFRRAGGPVPASRVLLVATAAAVSVVLLGGGAGPAPVPPAVWLALKTAAVTVGLVAVDRALPALSPDTALRIAARFGLPLAALQVALAAVVANPGSS